MRLQAVLLICLLPLPGQAGPGQDALERFFAEVSTFSAEFFQSVLDPSLQTLATSEGHLYIHRPGHFRWDYAPPDQQRIIGDGERVWIYDIDLEQVTVRPQRSVLGESVALLLAGDGQLPEDYAVKELGRQGPYDWVEIRPAVEEAHFASVRLGFADGQLQALEMIDQIDQRSRILFNEVKENPALAAALFKFTPPGGVEVLEVGE